MVTVGIDPHKHVHVAVAVSDDGRPIGKPLTVKNDALLIITLLKWVRSITDGTATWAIEDGRGFARRLADGLLLGRPGGGLGPGRLAAAHRKLHAATGAKSDPIDAAAVARAAIATPGPGPAPHRRARARAARPGRLPRRSGQAPHHGHQPAQGAACTSGSTTRRETSPAPGTVTALTTLVSAAQLGPHVRQALADMISRDSRSQPGASVTSTPPSAELVSPLAPALLQITGISYNSAAVLIAEIGDITRFSSSAKLARYTGCAPIPRLLLRQGTPPPPPRRQPAPQQRPLHRSHRAEDAAPRRPSNSWPATSQPKAPAAHAGSCNAT